MFNLEGSVDRYLYVKPGKLSWHITSSLKAEKTLIDSGSVGESCPAHPSNFSINNQYINITNWRFNKAGENQDANNEEGGVIVRCALHDAVHGQWLFEQGREGLLQKEKVGALLCEKDKKGSFLFSLFDIEVQIEAAKWNVQATSRIAHMLSADFVQWIIRQANEGKWSKEDVGSIVCRKSADNKLILATLDRELQKQVAVFNKATTCSAVPFMDADFLQWLYQEAESGRWEKQMVFDAVVKEELDGKANFSPRINSGIQIFIVNDCNRFMIYIFHQPLNSQAVEAVEIIKVTKWGGLNF